LPYSSIEKQRQKRGMAKIQKENLLSEYYHKLALENDNEVRVISDEVF
jgi:hypothetical protein